MKHLNLCPLWNDYVDKFRVGDWYENPMCYSEPSVSYVEEEDNVYYFQPTVRKVVPTNQFWYRSKGHQIIEPTTPASFIGSDGQPLEILSHVHDKSLKLNVITLSGEIKELGQNLYYKSEDRGKFVAIYMPDSVETIGEQAFRQIGYGIYIQYSNNLKTLGTKSMTGDGFTDVYLPDSVEYIGPYCFSYSGIQRLRLPNNPNLSFGEQAFVLSWGMAHIVFPSSQALSAQCFQGNTDLTSAEFIGVNTISDWAFYACSGLEKIILSTSTEKLSTGCFYNCTNLKEVEFSNSVTEIGGASFQNCTSLREVVLPSNITILAEQLFQGCSSLQSVTIPSGIIDIKNNVFTDCGSLTELVFNGTMAEWEAITKQSDWALDTPITTIHCTDGDITL